MLEQLAFKILAFYSLLLSYEPQLNNPDWTVIKNWQFEDGYIVFEADGSNFIEKCHQNQSAYIKFPLIISSIQKVTADNITLYPHTGPENGSIIGLLSIPAISCSQIQSAKTFKWKVFSASRIFSNQLFLPKIVNHKPFLSVISEAIHLISAAILLFLSVFAFVVFRGKLQKRFLAGFILASLLWANYSITDGPWLWIFDLSFSSVHRYLEANLLLGVVFLFYLLLQQCLLHRLIFYILVLTTFGGLVFVIWGRDLETIYAGINLNHGIYFLCLIDVLLLMLIRIKNNFNQDNLILLVGVISFAAMAINDILTINGTWHSSMMAPLGVAILFISLGVIIQRQIKEVYTQRDEYGAKLEKAYQEKLDIIQKNAVAHAVANTVQMIAHDLKNPFSMVKILLKQVQTNSLPSEAVKRLSTAVDENMQYVDRLLSDLLIGGNSVNKLEPTDFSSLLNEAWQGVYSQDKKPYLFVKEFDHTRQLFVDRIKIKRLLTNILSNAIESMDKESRKIWIKTRDKWANDREYVEITIGNEGSYISEDNIEKIFSKFHTYNKKNGSGLGLAICCEIVKSHGGEINCRSDRDVGTEFIFTLPAV